MVRSIFVLCCVSMFVLHSHLKKQGKPSVLTPLVSSVASLLASVCHRARTALPYQCSSTQLASLFKLPAAMTCLAKVEGTIPHRNSVTGATQHLSWVHCMRAKIELVQP